MIKSFILVFLLLLSANGVGELVEVGSVLPTFSPVVSVKDVTGIELKGVRFGADVSSDNASVMGQLKLTYTPTLDAQKKTLHISHLIEKPALSPVAVAPNDLSFNITTQLVEGQFVRFLVREWYDVNKSYEDPNGKMIYRIERDYTGHLVDWNYERYAHDINHIVFDENTELVNPVFVFNSMSRDFTNDLTSGLKIRSVEIRNGIFTIEFKTNRPDWVGGVGIGDLVTVSQAITQDTNWYDGNTYFVNVDGNLSVIGTGVDLNIEPGAIVKFKSSSKQTRLEIGTNAAVVSQGTNDKNILFMSCKDQNYGVDTSAQPGCSGVLTRSEYYAGLYLLASSDHTATKPIQYNRFYDAIYGIYFEGQEAWLPTVNNNQFLYFDKNSIDPAGIYMEAGGDQTSFESNYFYDFKNSYGIFNYGNQFSDMNFNAFKKFESSYGFYIRNSNYGDLYGNNFSDFNFTYAIYLVSEPISAGQHGEIFKNNFVDSWQGTGIRTNLAYNGNIHDNNFINLQGNGSGTGHGIYFQEKIIDSNIYNNTFDNVYRGINFSGGPVFLNGHIFNNKYLNGKLISGPDYYRFIDMFRSVRIRGNVYNNVVDLNGDGFFIRGNSSASQSNMDGNIFNNTVKGPNTQAVFYITSIGLFNGKFYNNIFVDLNNVIRDYAFFNGVLYNNAYLNTQGPYLSANTVNDQNTQTGFTVNPFDLNNLNRAFLLNSHASGGLKLVNAGTGTGNDILSDVNFLKARTTQPNNKLDRVPYDMGYHYDQNAPYAVIIRPNDSNTLVGVQGVDWNIESGFGLPGIVDWNLYYSPTQSIGTLLVNGTLNSSYCGSRTNVELYYQCHYDWNTLTVDDGNYFVGIWTQDSNGYFIDWGDKNFRILNVVPLGVLLDVNIILNPRIVLQGDLNNLLIGYVKNVGDANALDVNVFWILPNGFVLAFGDLNTSIGTLDVNEEKVFDLNFDVLNTASVGYKTVYLSGVPDGDVSRIDTNSVLVFVAGEAPNLLPVGLAIGREEFDWFPVLVFGVVIGVVGLFLVRR